MPAWVAPIERTILTYNRHTVPVFFFCAKENRRIAPAGSRCVAYFSVGILASIFWTMPTAQCLACVANAVRMHDYPRRCRYSVRVSVRVPHGSAHGSETIPRPNGSNDCEALLRARYTVCRRTRTWQLHSIHPPVRGMTR